MCLMHLKHSSLAIPHGTVLLQYLTMSLIKLSALICALLGASFASNIEDLRGKPDSTVHGRWSSDNKLHKVMKGKYEKFKKADPAKYLAIARILKDGHDHCLATVADRDWVITAAHCVADFASPEGMSRLSVVAGDFVGSQKDAAEQSVKVVEVVLHDNYKDGAKEFNDIAVVRVDPSIMFNSKLVPVNIPDDRSLPRPGTAWVTTWLPLVASAKKGQLAELTVEVLKKDQCLNRYPYENNFVGKSRYCTADSFGAASCFGSQADPVFIEDDKGIIYQVGIINDGSTKCGSELAVHTKLSNFAGWIQRKISGCKKTESSEEKK